ncbi:MAG: multicopper oxidase domain-containing protein [Bacteroidota bacterium]|nr:multicopper oxidase domain-containing protein [Bacteroidota bacterium]
MIKKILLFALFTSSNFLYSQSALLIPDTLSGSVINLNLQKGTVQFFPGNSTQTMGANGNLLGPTIMLRKNQNVKMNVTNNINEATTIHWHGMHVAPENDGGPHVVIQNGQTWSPSFEVLDHASTHWYHPHLHEKTHDHVQMGIAGFIYVRDNEEAAINLPRTYGLDDIPLVVQTKAFDANNQIITAHTALDSILLVNGTLKPFWNAPAQIVRLRLLNGSSERVYNFGFNDNRTFHMIGSDGGLLTAPVSLTRLLLAPGERAEILVNLSADNSKSIRLMNYGSQIPNAHYGAAQPGMGPGQTIPNYTLNRLNGRDFTVLDINVGPATSNPVTTIPTSLISHNPLAESQANITRQLTFTSMAMGQGAINGPFVINGQHFDMDVINYRVPFENIEIWELRNQSPIAHPFHIHNVPFYILDINGNAPPAHLRGRKDVVLVPAGNSTVRFITKFEDFHNDTIPYMYHCHMLTHEDEGMMGQFVVLPPCQIMESQPVTQNKDLSETALFSVLVNDTMGVSYQWQSNTGFGFLDLQNAGQYSGVRTSQLVVSNLVATNHNQLFRCNIKSPICDLTSDVVSIQINTLSTNLPSTNHFRIYPNPTNDKLFIRTELSDYFIKVTNLVGQVMVEESAQGNHAISLNHLRKGVYLVSIKESASQMVYYQKIIID